MPSAGSDITRQSWGRCVRRWFVSRRSPRSVTCWSIMPSAMRSIILSCIWSRSWTFAWNRRWMWLWFILYLLMKTFGFCLCASANISSPHCPKSSRNRFKSRIILSFCCRQTSRSRKSATKSQKAHNKSVTEPHAHAVSRLKKFTSGIAFLMWQSFSDPTSNNK